MYQLGEIVFLGVMGVGVFVSQSISDLQMTQRSGKPKVGLVEPAPGLKSPKLERDDSIL
jgi:hypothetical protein